MPESTSRLFYAEQKPIEAIELTVVFAQISFQEKEIHQRYSQRDLPPSRKSQDALRRTRIP